MEKQTIGRANVGKVTAQAVVAAAKPDAAPAATAQTPEVLVVVKKGVVYRGARKDWYDRLVAMDGKPKAEVLADLEAKRPSVYGSKSKHAGKPEPVAGWVQFYVRNGIVKFAAPAAK